MQLSLSTIVSSCRARFSSRDRKSGYTAEDYDDELFYRARAGLSIREEDTRLREEYSKTAIARNGGVTWPRHRAATESEVEEEEEQQTIFPSTISIEEEMANLQYRGPRMDTIDEEELSDLSLSSRTSRRISSTVVTDESSVLSPSILSSCASSSYFTTSALSSARSSRLSDSSLLSQHAETSTYRDSSYSGYSTVSTSTTGIVSSGSTGLIISPLRGPKPVNFIWDYAGRRRFQEAAALHSILSTHFANLFNNHQQPQQYVQPQASLTTPPSTPLSARSSSSSFPAGDEDDVMSTITVEGGTAPTRHLVDQFAFIADAGVMKKKKVMAKGKAGSRAIEGSYWGEDDEWRESERENMTAVCMEEWSRAGKRGRIETGVTFRVAMNSGVPADVLEWLKGIAAVMENFAKGLKGELECEDILWSMVVEMNQKKIREDIIKRFYAPAKRPLSGGPGRNIENCVEVLASKIAPVLQQAQGELSQSGAAHIREGTQNLAHVHQLCERVVEQGHRGDARLWKELLVQCYHLRRSRGFRAFLFGFLNGYDLFRTIQKLGRYRLATQALIDAVRAHPHQFRIVEVHAIPTMSFYDVNSSIYPDADLRGYLRGILNTWRITAISKENTEKIRTEFREKCADLPVVHAEMQLVKYYEENPMMERPTVIGCSKKPCQLCVRFLDLHGQFSVEKSHARISHRWSMPNIACHAAEGMAHINEILESMTLKMEDTLRESLGAGAEKKREGSGILPPSSRTPLPSPGNPLLKKSFSKSILDLPATASWDSGFGESMSSRTGSIGGSEREKATNGPETPRGLLCDPVTPPPSRSLHDLLPEVPESPPPLRRRRRSPISLKDEYKCLKAVQDGLPPTIHTPRPGRGQPSPPPFSPPRNLHRPSSPTLGWSTRFPKHNVDNDQAMRTSIAIPPTPPPDARLEEVNTDDLQAVFGRQLYHGDQQDSGIYGTCSEPGISSASENPQSPVGHQRNDSETLLPVLDGPDSFFPMGFPESRSTRSSCSQRSPEHNIFNVPQAILSQELLILGSPDSFYTHSFADASPCGPVDIQILDQSSSLHNIGSSNRLPTPPDVDITHLKLDDDDEVLHGSRTGISQAKVHLIPPKDIPHILISSPAARLQRQKDSMYIQSPSTLISTSTPPSTPTSSDSSLVSQNARHTSPPALSRRQTRSRHPLAPASLPSLTSAAQKSPSRPRSNSTTTTPSHCSSSLTSSDNYRQRSHTPQLRHTTPSVGTGSRMDYQSDDSSSYTYWTSNISSTIHSNSSSDVSVDPISNATVVPLRRKAPMLMRGSALGILEKEVTRVMLESGALKSSRSIIGSNGGGSMGGSELSMESSNVYRHSTASNSTHPRNSHHHHHHHNSTNPSVYMPKAPGLKSFLLKVRRPSISENNDHSSDSSHHRHHKHHLRRSNSSSNIPDVSWISVDISEELLRGSDRFEVTAQLLAPEKQPTPASRRTSKTQGMILRHEYKKDEELLILDVEFGAAVLRLKIFW